MITCCQYFVPVCFRWAGIYRIKTDKPELFLTFDDGPSSEVTPFVLETLAKVQAQATFFCSGKQIKQYPELFSEIKKQNHVIGNHGYEHYNGLKTSNKIFFADIEKTDKLINSSLFRPPFGKLKPSQYFSLKKHYKIIFWTIMTRDFDVASTWQEDFEKIKPYLKKGAIIVFHDTYKAEEKLRKMLPAILDYCIRQGFEFSGLI